MSELESDLDVVASEFTRSIGAALEQLQKTTTTGGRPRWPTGSYVVFVGTADEYQDRRFIELSAYNARCGKGVLHGERTVEAMASIQREYDEWIARQP